MAKPVKKVIVNNSSNNRVSKKEVILGDQEEMKKSKTVALTDNDLSDEVFQELTTLQKNFGGTFGPKNTGSTIYRDELFANLSTAGKRKTKNMLKSIVKGYARKFSEVSSQSEKQQIVGEFNTFYGKYFKIQDYTVESIILGKLTGNYLKKVEVLLEASRMASGAPIAKKEVNEKSLKQLVRMFNEKALSDINPDKYRLSGEEEDIVVELTGAELPENGEEIDFAYIVKFKQISEMPDEEFNSLLSEEEIDTDSLFTLISEYLEESEK